MDWAEFEEAETAEGRAESKRWGKEAAGGSVDEYGGKRNAFFCAIYAKNELIVPRQARDKHRNVQVDKRECCVLLGGSDDISAVKTTALRNLPCVSFTLKVMVMIWQDRLGTNTIGKTFKLKRRSRFVSGNRSSWSPR